MNVIERIEQAPACEVINLTDAEKTIYSGAGWKVARFVGGELAALFDPCDVPHSENTQEMTGEAMLRVLEWMKEPGEYWLVQCSAYQLCEPRKLSIGNTSYAHMARMFGEQFAGLA